MRCPKCKDVAILQSEGYKCTSCSHSWLQKPSKYGAIKCELNGIVFDSKLERNVYLALLVGFKAEDIKVHYPIPIAEANRHYPAWSWKIDFFIPKLNLYIDAKGVRTEGFKEKLHAISVLRPDVLDRLVIVGDKAGEKVTRAIKTITIPELNAIFRDFHILQSKEHNA